MAGQHLEVLDVKNFCPPLRPNPHPLGPPLGGAQGRGCCLDRRETLIASGQSMCGAVTNTLRQVVCPTMGVLRRLRLMISVFPRIFRIGPKRRWSRPDRQGKRPHGRYASRSSPSNWAAGRIPRLRQCRKSRRHPWAAGCRRFRSAVARRQRERCSDSGSRLRRACWPCQLPLGAQSSGCRPAPASHGTRMAARRASWLARSRPSGLCVDTTIHQPIIRHRPGRRSTSCPGTVPSTATTFPAPLPAWSSCRTPARPDRRPARTGRLPGCEIPR